MIATVIWRGASASDFHSSALNADRSVMRLHHVVAVHAAQVATRGLLNRESETSFEQSVNFRRPARRLRSTTPRVGSDPDSSRVARVALQASPSTVSLGVTVLSTSRGRVAEPSYATAVPSSSVPPDSGAPVAASWPVTDRLKLYCPCAPGQNWTEAVQLWPGASVEQLLIGTL